MHRSQCYGPPRECPVDGSHWAAITLSFCVQCKLDHKTCMKGVHAMKQSLKRLQNPPKEYRPIPFWSWNERLTVSETRWQIDEMDKVGIGGYFMHARGGLQTPYMGEEWMHNIEAGIEEARERGMGAWAYDENGWPSGFGDGLVNGRGLEYQQKYLRMERVSQETQRDDGRTITNAPLGDEWAHFYFDVNPFYVDTLDAHVIKTFLDEIYTPYAERFSHDLGKAMPGFFTDEPQVSRNGIPWSFTFPTKYREAYGEELLPLLPQLFTPVGDYQRTRYRFWHLVQELFVTSYTQQIHDWCEAHGCQLTGHMVLEESLLSQITSNAAVMPHYEFFHIPGMDWLGRHINPPTTPLQLASVAHQLGLRHILSETFALCGWNVTFEELKWIYEWQCVRGVTLLCQHLEAYSLRGIRKRDYPPSLFYQEPWWDRYHLFNDAMSRLGMLLSDGDPHFEVLVMHPQASAWLHYDDGENQGIAELDEAFMQLTHALEAAHVPFHYGDERILSRHGRVEAQALRVGSQAYRAVIVPPTETWSQSTVDLLSQFANAGGVLIWVGQQPTRIAGERAPSLSGLTSRGTHVETATAAVDALPAALRPISIADDFGAEIGPIAATWRRFESFEDSGPADFYFFANADPERGYIATIRLPGAAVVRVMLEDGSLHEIPYTREGNELIVRHKFPRRGSLALLAFSDGNATAALKGVIRRPERTDSNPLEASLLNGEWELMLLDPNALTLDVCDIWVDGELVAEQEHISVVQKRCLDRGRAVDLTLRFTVEVAPDYSGGDLHLVVERPETFDISVNGETVAQQDQGYYRDKSFRKIPISGMLRPGTNAITLHTLFQQSPQVYENLERAQVFEAEKNKLTYDSEIEAIYLIGAFGVRTPGTFEAMPRKALCYSGPFVLGAVPERAPIEDLTRHGLPFFNGRVRLTRHITLGNDAAQKRCFRFEEAMAQIVKLTVNGEDVREWLWRPFQADLTGLLRAGDNELCIELTNGLRNLLGPHHLPEGESYAVHPGLFFKEPNVWGHVPHWNEDYCFVEFGLRF